MELQEHPHRSAKILILANVTEPRTLQWKDPYSKDLAPESFPPKADVETGATVYELPFAYAERLLRGEPNKYKLLFPKRVKMNFPTLNGGFERRDLFAVTPKLDQLGNIVLSNNIPVYRELTNTERQKVVDHQINLSKGIVEPEPTFEEQVAKAKQEYAEVKAAGFVPRTPSGPGLKALKEKMAARRTEEKLIVKEQQGE